MYLAKITCTKHTNCKLYTLANISFKGCIPWLYSNFESDIEVFILQHATTAGRAKILAATDLGLSVFLFFEGNNLLWMTFSFSFSTSPRPS